MSCQFINLKTMRNLKEEEILKLLEKVCDPEIPVLSILDLGVVRKLEVLEDHILIYITPTYTGCPAMRVIEDDIRGCLSSETDAKIEIKTIFAPAWTTDWMSDSAKEKLTTYGISPPGKTSSSDVFSFNKKEVAAICPLCKSGDTVLKSFFGSTACKSLYFCNHCGQPFEHFKCI